MRLRRVYSSANNASVSFTDKDLDNNCTFLWLLPEHILVLISKQVLITRVLYWSVLEEGLALVVHSPFRKTSYLS